MAATRTVVEAEIADDLQRNDIANQITKAVDTAIRAYEEERFFFNEAYAVSVTLSSSVAFIAQSALPTRFVNLDRVRLKKSATFYTDLYKRDYAWLMAQQDIVTSSEPYEYCIYNEKLLFDNYADQNYTLVLDGIKSLGNTASDTYSAASAVAWFNTARELIRHRAKREIYMHVLKDANLAAMAKLAEQEAFETLKGKTNSRVATGIIRATDF
jgi:hypothetical protein